MRSPKRGVAAAAALALCLAACASRQAGAPLTPGYNSYTVQDDIQIGREAAAKVRQQADIVQNQQLQSYVDRIGQKLVSQPRAGDFPYTFTLINDDTINAFALPGGPIFINSATVAAADNEGELAGVLAHEIGHVALRHGTSQASKANLVELPAALAGAVIGQDSALGQAAQIGLGLGLNSVLLSYSREAETEADAFGAHLMSEAGYNPIEEARFFEKLQAQGGSSAPQFLSDHPNPGNRMQAVEAEIRTLPQRQYNAGTGQLPRMKQMVAQLPPPKKTPEQGLSAE